MASNPNPPKETEVGQDFDLGFPEAPSEWSFNMFLDEIANEIVEEEFQRVKHIFTGIIGERFLEKCQNIRDIFKIMRQKRYLGNDNLLYLQRLIFQLNRPKLQEKCIEYSKRQGNVYFYSPPDEPASGNGFVKIHVEGIDGANCRPTFLKKLRYAVASIACMPEEKVFFAGVQKSCSMLITLMIPNLYIDILQKMLIRNDNMEELVEIGVDIIGIGDTQYNIRDKSAAAIKESEKDNLLPFESADKSAAANEESEKDNLLRFESADEKYREENKKENEELVRKIIEFCNRNDYKQQNVLLVGQIGSGKSSVINTILYSVIGQYYKRAKTGAGSATSKTVELTWYKNCAAKPTDFNEEIQVRAPNSNPSPTNLTRKKQFKDVKDKLPNLFDVAGMKNINSPENREILSLLIGGFIDPGTTTTILEEEQKNGLGWLKTKYSTAKDEYKISCVVFVCSCLAPIPYNLIKCLRDVIEEVDPDTSRKKYDCDVYVLITKYDMVKSDAGTEQGQAKQPEIIYSRDRSNLPTMTGECESAFITLKELRDIEKELAEKFVMMGSFKDSHLLWASYNDSLLPGNVLVDNNSLKLLYWLTAPLHIDQTVNPRRNWLLESIKYMIFRAKGVSKQKFDINMLVLISLVIAIIAVLLICLYPNLAVARLFNTNDN